MRVRHVVRLRFKDGLERVVDLEPHVFGPVLEQVRNDPRFFAAGRVDPDAGTIVWPNGADLAPDVLYSGCLRLGWKPKRGSDSASASCNSLRVNETTPHDTR